MKILGISALYHDAAAALIEDGKIVAAVQEERFTRVKHDKRIPINAIKFCLKQGQCKFADLDAVAYYDNPILTLQRFCQNVCTLKEHADELIKRSFDDMLEDKIWIRHNLLNEFGSLGKRGKFLVSEHHLSHAASAFYPSPFEKALILTNDGVGEWETTTIGVGEGRYIRLLKNIHYPHSLGLLIYYEILKSNVIDIKDDGSYRLNLKYFDYQNGRTMITPQLEKLLGGTRRQPEGRITKREMNIAASVQKITEEIIIKQAYYAKSLHLEINNLVLAGGVALNCVANGKLLKECVFKNIWIQPAAGDAGGAIGCALYAYHSYFEQERFINCNDSQGSTYLGSSFTSNEIEEYLKKCGAQYKKVEEENLVKQIAEEIASGRVVGHFNGRAEFGPRSLGNRSILADARSAEMQSKLNLKIKYRESFRPFAPSVLKERVEDYFMMERGGGKSIYAIMRRCSESETVSIFPKAAVGVYRYGYDSYCK